MTDTIAVFNPSTEEQIAEVVDADQAMVDAAVARARETFESGVWRKLPAARRAEVLFRAAEIVKQRTDELEYARLLEDNVPAAPIYSGWDGGMNKVFQAQFPYRVTLAKVMPYASYIPQIPPIPWIDNDGSLTSKWFGIAFSKPIACDPARASFPSGRC